MSAILNLLLYATSGVGTVVIIVYLWPWIWKAARRFGQVSWLERIADTFKAAWGSEG